MATLEISKHIRRPLFVDAVRVTAQNRDDVAEWCSGDVYEARPGDIKTGKYIKVRVTHPRSIRQTQAFEGDWVLYAETGWKVYSNKAFVALFDPITSSQKTSRPKPRPPHGRKSSAIPARTASPIQFSS